MIEQDLQQISGTSMVELFELDCTSVGGDVLRFHNGTNVLGANVVWQGNTYQAYPIEASGFEFRGKGQLPRPTLRVANITGLLGALVRSYQDLVGCKLTRKRTLLKYLDDANYPNAQKPASLLTVTRAGTAATYFDSAGVMRVAAANTPRVTYDPTNLAAGSKLLVEESRTNTLLWSGNMSNAVWVKRGTTNPTAGAADPFGGTSGWLVTVDQGGANDIYQTTTGLTANAAASASFFIKRVTANKILVVQNPAGSGTYRVDLSALSNGYEWITPNHPAVTVVTPFTATAGGAAGLLFYSLDNTPITFNYGGGQVEVGAVATSYIPTTTATVSRPADLPVVTGANFSSWFNAAAGTFLVDATVENTTTGNRSMIDVNRGAAGYSSRHQLTGWSSGTGASQYAVVDDSGTVIVGGLQVTGAATTKRVSFSYAQDDFIGSTNGVLSSADTSGTPPTTVAQLSIGVDDSGGANFLNGGISRIAYYRRRLTNAEQQTITSGGSVGTPDMEMIFTNGSVQTYLLQPYNPSADPTAELPDDVYFIDRKANENKVLIEFELAAAFDVAGVQLPRRFIIQNICPWTYRGAECGYAGTAYFDTNDNPVTSLALDVCGKRLSSCKCRFGQYAELPYGGFPASGLTR